MTDLSKVKVKPSHSARQVFIYVRQSSVSQVEHNRESTARQYALGDRAQQLGWPKDNVVIIDDDLGLSGATTNKRSGFARMISEVALGHVGMILGLEVSRLARNNADWYRLLKLCGLTDTLIGDADGVYHPALFNDRLLLGLKGTMSEAELHIIRARLDGGIRNKAARGELRRGLPVGFVWGDDDGEVLFHPDEAVVTAVRSVFERFAEFGSARRVWLWLRAEAPSFPLQDGPAGQIRWVAPTYTAVHHILTNPVYAGAYTYGKSRWERYVDENGTVRKRIRKLPMDQWGVLIREHHAGFIDWATYESIQKRLDSNTPSRSRYSELFSRCPRPAFGQVVIIVVQLFPGHYSKLVAAVRNELPQRKCKMNLVELLTNSGGDAAVGQLGSRFGLDESQTQAALQFLVPALGNGLQRNVASEGGLDSLLGALSSGNHAEYIDNPEMLNDEAATQTGNGILGHLLGSKEASRELAATASAETGIGSDVLKQMLPLVATMVMGTLSRRSDQSGYLDRPDSPAQPEGFLSMLTPLLDSNRDGSVADDVLGMIGRYMRNR